METVLGAVGVIGAALCILAYFLLEREKLSSSGIAYYSMNGVGAVLLLIASFYHYDSGDLGVAVQELCWIAVSLMGITKVLRKNKRANNDQN